MNGAGMKEGRLKVGFQTTFWYLWDSWAEPTLRWVSGNLGSEVEGGVDEAFGVVFLRVVEDLVCAAVFDEFSVLHDGDVVADGADDGEVVADEDVGQSVFGLESAQQFDDFDLDGAVEGGGGFVEEDELGPQDEGAGDGDALALSA